MAAGFNLIVTRAALSHDQLGSRDLLWLAVLAGMALNTRPSIGAALCVGTALLVLWTALRWHFAITSDQAARRGAGVLKRFERFELMARDRRILAPVTILGLFGAVAGVVNFRKWENLFTFANYRYATMRSFRKTRWRFFATTVRSTSGACSGIVLFYRHPVAI